MAARRHWRFTVRDQFGFVVQNALVFVYQPGTTTVFTGTCYNAASGGSTITNPFTTNSQGEVEGWFDTAQVVDVLVTDNTDTAFRAVSPTLPISFTSFTEADDIYVSASDQVSTDFGEAGDIGADIANPYTSVTATAGATGEYADAGHRHPYTALTPGTPPRGITNGATGDDLEPARDDHQHPIQGAGGRTNKFTTTSDTNEQVIWSSNNIPANSLAAGSMFKINLRAYQTNGTTACTYTFRVRWGTGGGVVVGNALALIGTTTAHTDNPVSLDFLMTVLSIGATGTAVGDWFGSECITTATANTPKLVLGVQTAAATIDTTAAKVLEISVQMNTTTGTPNLEVENVLIEQVA
jgi:hypothetical protein